MRQFNFVRLAEIRAMLADIKSADKARLSDLYKVHIGYCPFDDDPSAIVESVRDDLIDFLREVGANESIHWHDISDDE